jgi:hypothetical protein
LFGVSGTIPRVRQGVQSLLAGLSPIGGTAAGRVLSPKNRMVPE